MSTAVMPMPTLEIFKKAYISMNLYPSLGVTRWRNQELGRTYVCPFAVLAIQAKGHLIYDEVDIWGYIHSTYGENNTSAFIKGYDYGQSYGGNDEERAWNKLGQEVRAELYNKIDWR